MNTRPQELIVALLATLALLGSVLGSPADPVFDEGLNLLLNSPEFEDAMGKNQESLAEMLKNHPALEYVYFPRKYSIPVDFYV